MTDLIQFFHKTRDQYPEFTSAADKLHIDKFEEVDEELSYLWFENLANAINADINSELFTLQHSDFFKYMSEQFKCGNSEVKYCIDVAFVENLFWRVSRKGAELFWENIPATLKTLYLGFHGRAPL